MRAKMIQSLLYERYITLREQEGVESLIEIFGRFGSFAGVLLILIFLVSGPAPSPREGKKKDGSYSNNGSVVLESPSTRCEPLAINAKIAAFGTNASPSTLMHWDRSSKSPATEPRICEISSCQDDDDGSTRRNTVKCETLRVVATT